MVSIIIVSYNTRKLLEECIVSLYKNIKDQDFEIIVLDNDSKDQSVEMIKKKFTKVRVIANRENVGFAKANNIGIRHARGEYVLFLNSDTTVENNNIKHLLELIEKNKDIVVVGALLKNPKGDIEKSFGKFPNFFSIFKFIILGERFENASLTGTPFEVDWVNGAGMLVRKNVFEKLNGFDEHFFMYVEDMEFCFRVKRAGYKVYYDPTVEIVHLGQGSSNRSFAIIHIYKGILYFYRKHKTFLEYAYIKFLLTSKAIIAIIIGILSGNLYLVQTYKKTLSF